MKLTQAILTALDVLIARPGFWQFERSICPTITADKLVRAKLARRSLSTTGNHLPLLRITEAGWQAYFDAKDIPAPPIPVLTHNSTRS
jgi:hypothetical protein